MMVGSKLQHFKVLSGPIFRDSLRTEQLTEMLSLAYVEQWATPKSALVKLKVRISAFVKAKAKNRPFDHGSMLVSLISPWMAQESYDIDDSAVIQVGDDVLAIWPFSFEGAAVVFMGLVMDPMTLLHKIHNRDELIARLDPVQADLFDKVVRPHNTNHEDRELREMRWLLITLGETATAFKANKAAELEARDWANRFIRASSWKALAEYAQFVLIKTLVNEDVAFKRGACMIREVRLNRPVVDTTDTFRVTQEWWNLALGK